MACVMIFRAMQYSVPLMLFWTESAAIPTLGQGLRKASDSVSCQASAAPA